MSREFGSYINGYFHNQIQNCAKDAMGGRDELTRLWGEFLNEFYPIAYAISASEEDDSGPYNPIMATIDRLKILEKRFGKIKDYVGVYKQVAEEAVRKALEEQ